MTIHPSSTDDRWQNLAFYGQPDRTTMLSPDIHETFGSFQNNAFYDQPGRTIMHSLSTGSTLGSPEPQQVVHGRHTRRHQYPITTGKEDNRRRKRYRNHDGRQRQGLLGKKGKIRTKIANIVVQDTYQDTSHQHTQNPQIPKLPSSIFSKTPPGFKDQDDHTFKATNTAFYGCPGRTTMLSPDTDSTSVILRNKRPLTVKRTRTGMRLKKRIGA
jgi:hypothetical protein